MSCGVAEGLQSALNTALQLITGLGRRLHINTCPMAAAHGCRFANVWSLSRRCCSTARTAPVYLFYLSYLSYLSHNVSPHFICWSATRRLYCFATAGLSLRNSLPQQLRQPDTSTESFNRLKNSTEVVFVCKWRWSRRSVANCWKHRT